MANLDKAGKTASPTKRNYVKPELILLAGTNSEGRAASDAGTQNAKSNFSTENSTFDSTLNGGITLWYGPS